MLKNLLISVIVFLVIITSGIIIGKKYLDYRLVMLQQDLLSLANNDEDYTVAIEQIEGSWHNYSYILNLGKLEIKDKINNKVVYKQASATIEIDLLNSIIKQSPALKKITLNKAQLNLELKYNGRLEKLSLKDIINNKSNNKLLLGLLAQKFTVALNNSQFILAIDDHTKIQLNLSANFIMQEGVITQLELIAPEVNIINDNFNEAIIFNNVMLKTTGKNNIYAPKKLSFIFNKQDIKLQLAAVFSSGKLSKLEILSNKINIPVADVVKYLPRKLLAPDLLNWLETSLKKGNITDFSYYLDNNKEYKLILGFSELDLDYTDKWPSLTDLSGTFVLANNYLEIIAPEAKISGQVITNLQAKINPLQVQDKISPLIISGDLNITVMQGLIFLENSPLKQSVGEKIKSLKPSGNINLQLGLEIPFTTADNTIKVLGNITLKNGAVVLPKLEIPCKDIQGNLNFSNDAIFADSLQVNLFEQKRIVSFDYVTPNRASNLTLLNFKINDLLNGKIEFVADQIKSGSINLGDKAPAEWRKENGLLINGNLNDVKALPLNKFSSTDKNFVSSFNFPIHLDLPQIKGEIILPSLEKQEYRINLEELDLAALQSNINTSTPIKLTSNLPMVMFRCAKCYLNTNHLVNMRLNLIPHSYGYDINEIQINNPNYQFSGEAQWRLEKDKDESTTLTGTITSGDFGALLRDQAYSNSILGGKANIIFSLGWPGGPFALKLSNLNGSAKFNVTNGVIKGVEQGLSKILSFLSVESIQRRLKLDFTDLSSKGLTFDSFIADLDFEHGLATTKQMQLNGPTAKISLKGEANLATKLLNMDMYVMPKVAAGLPVAAAVAAGNPAVGAAVWLFDKTVGLKMDELTIYHYKITGPLQAPSLTEVITNRK